MGDYSIQIFFNNNILYLLFMEIDVSFNGKVIFFGMDIYLYKVYLEKLFLYKLRILII